MKFSAEVIADSITGSGDRLTTFALTFPRIILPEFNTHRVFSRNARSTRAVPTKTLIKEVRENPYIPTYFGANRPGMQATEELPPEVIEEVKLTYLKAAKDAADHAERLMELGLHKQHAGRLLEPFIWTSVCVTSSEWENWFYLRDHEEAQPEIREIASLMRQAMDASTPEELSPGEWHLPYVTTDDRAKYDTEQLLKISVARCARVSYKNFEGKVSTAEQDLALYEKLTGDPPHLSPTEHQATPDPFYEEDHLHGNFFGWVQYRKIIEQSTQ